VGKSLAVERQPPPNDLRADVGAVREEAGPDKPLVRAGAVKFTSDIFVADDPAHLLARLGTEIAVVGVTGVNDLGRVDALQADARVGVGQDDGVAIYHSHMAAVAGAGAGRPVSSA